MTGPRSSYREGLRLAIPFAIAVGGFGITFGALAHATNVGLLAIVVMSATTFGGSAQFAAVSLLAQGSSVGAAVVAALLLQARYVPMSVAAAPSFSGPWWKRLLQGQLIVDESWAIGNRGDGTFDRARIVAAGALLYVNWVLWSAVGAAGAELLKDPRAYGLDAAFPALFLAILWPYVRERHAAVAAALGAAIALAAAPFVPPGVPIVLATAACVAGARG